MCPTRPLHPLRGAATVLCALALFVVGGCGTHDDVGSTSTTDGGSRVTIAGGDHHVGLDDGEHQVLVESVDADAHTVTVDAVEVLSDDAAAEAYLQDTGVALRGPRTYVRDVRKDPRTLPADPGGRYGVIFAPECCEAHSMDFAAFAAMSGRGFPDRWGTSPPFAVTIEDGVVVSLVQTYVP